MDEILAKHIEIIIYNNFKEENDDLRFIHLNDKDKFYSSLSKYKYEDIANHLVSFFKANKIDYPYFRMFGSDLIKLFLNIRQCKNYFTNDKYDSNEQKGALFVLPLEFAFDATTQKYTLFNYDPEIYTTTDILADYYIELSRLQCKRSYAKFTALEEWYAYDKVLNKTLLNIISQKKSPTLNNIKIQFQKMTSECSGEKSTFYVNLFKSLYPSSTTEIKILDACAGYGNRLLGAMAANVKQYLG